MTDPARTPEWLSATEQDAWLAFLITTRALMAELDRQLQRDAGIPHAWYALLVVLAEHPERTARQSELAALTDFSLSRLSHALSRLAAKGWVRREPHPTDGRVTNVTLTEAGADALRHAAPGHVATVRELFFGPLSAKQVNDLHCACRAILAGLARTGTAGFGHELVSSVLAPPVSGDVDGR